MASPTLSTIYLEAADQTDSLRGPRLEGHLSFSNPSPSPLSHRNHPSPPSNPSHHSLHNLPSTLRHPSAPSHHLLSTRSHLPSALGHHLVLRAFSHSPLHNSDLLPHQLLPLQAAL